MADVNRQLSMPSEIARTRYGGWRDYVQLGKLRLNALVLVTTLIGYSLAAGDLGDFSRIVHVLFGVGIAAIGASALNQYLERDVDRLMHRTADRPLPAGRVAEQHALIYGVACLVVGVVWLALCVNLLSSFLCVLTAAIYLFLYTPLKKFGPVSTIVGAVPGATPPMVGWAAAHGELSVGAWVLFSILFMWQLPHFFSIAWIYRDDYRRAGMPMISLLDEDGKRTAQHIIMCTLNLVFVSLIPIAIGSAGAPYFYAALTLGILFLLLGLRFAQRRTSQRARHVLYGSLIYLPSLLSLWFLDGLLTPHIL